MIPPRFPDPTELQPLLEKLEAYPGSVVLLAIEQPEVCNFCRVTFDERKALRRALEVCRRKREKESAKNSRREIPPREPRLLRQGVLEWIHLRSYAAKKAPI